MTQKEYENLNELFKPKKIETLDEAISWIEAHSRTIDTLCLSLIILQNKYWEIDTAFNNVTRELEVLKELIDREL